MWKIKASRDTETESSWVKSAQSDQSSDEIGRNTQMMLLKHDSCIQIVSALTSLAVINGPFTAFSCSELAGLVNFHLTGRSNKAIRMDIFDDPLCIIFFIE